MGEGEFDLHKITLLIGIIMTTRFAWEWEESKGNKEHFIQVAHSFLIHLKVESTLTYTPFINRIRNWKIKKNVNI